MTILAMQRLHHTSSLEATAAPLRATVLALLLLGVQFPALAQYKVLHPDGSVTYTDRPPTSGDAKVIPLGRAANADPPDTTLPAELRQPLQRFPVTLYSAPDCTPCDVGRRLLQRRGIPYSERRVANDEDAAALERLVGGRTVPALTIGSQPIRGFSETEWQAYLDAAGYPKESRLPRGWQPPEPVTMVERGVQLRPSPPPPPREPTPEPVPEPPSGVRF